MRQTLLLIAAVAVLLAVPAMTGSAETPATATEPASCPAGTTAEASAALPQEVGEEGIEAIGLPEPTAMVCANEWWEYRWVYAGCCGGNQKKTKEQKRQCCFDQSGTHCSGWVDTGKTNCSGSCPV